MNSSRYIGRIGGLAVALGVGAAVFTGHGVAWAEPASSTSSDSSAGNAKTGGASVSSGTVSKGSGSATSTGPATSASDASSDESDETGAAPTKVTGKKTGAQAKPTRTSGSHRTPIASASSTGSSRTSDKTPGKTAAADDADVPSKPDAAVSQAEPTASTVPTVNSVVAKPNSLARRQAATPAAAPPPPSVPTVLANVLTGVLTPAAENMPAAPAPPVDPPASWVLLAAARRELSDAAVSLAPSNPIEVEPKLRPVADGLIFGNVNATDAKGLPLVYTVASKPSEGGKITFVPEAATPGTFSYLPYQTVLNSGTEQFSVRVNETTPFETALDAVPLVGLFVQPIGTLLNQVPGLSPFLVPFFGATVIVPFTANPSALNETGGPVAFTVKVISFDGTPISTNFFPAHGLQPGQSANTILEGPGLGSAGTTDPLSTDGILSIPGLVPGVAPLRNAGYNVVTWDPRGEYASGGVLQLDSPEFEARDVSAIIDMTLALPETKDHQRIGMVGGSYGGGIQLVTATIDPRINAIVPGIAWNTLNSSLYPKDVFKTAWGTLLILDLIEAGARINPQIYEGILTGALLGVLTPSQQALLARSGTGTDAGKITAPTLLIQGTADGLFPLREAVTNAQLLADAGTPVKMIWFCGGHGACLNPPSPIQQKLILNDTLAWLDQYVNQDPGKPADAIPNFQWVDQNGDFSSSDLMPSDPNFQGTPITASGPGGILPIAPVIGGSGPQLRILKQPLSLFDAALLSIATAAPAGSAINLTVPVPTGTRIVGAPRLTFTYSGLGTGRALYAQIVDDQTGLVLGNLATPIPVTLDGHSHTVTVAAGTLENVAYTATGPDSTLTVQLVGSATRYENFTAFGAIHVSDMTLSLPTVGPGANAAVDV